MKSAIPSRVAAVILAMTAAFASAPRAEAQSAASSRQHFAAAQKLFEDDRYADALPEFRAVLAESGSPNARLYIARCLRELGDLPAAYEEMSSTLRDARAKAENEPKYVQTRDAAAAELAVLEGKIAKIVIALADDASGAEITLNGKPVDSLRLGTPIAVMPGDETVHATLAGHDPVDRQATAQGGETRTITISFRAIDVAAPPPTVAPPASATAPPPAPPIPTEPTGGTVRKVGFVVGGLGIVGFGAFAVAGAMSSSKYNSLKAACGDQRCPNLTYVDNIDTGKQLDTIANVGLIVGIAGVVGGVTMIVLGGPKAPANTSVGFAPTRDGARLGISGAF